jgi:DNA-binding PadR family transcriptional regulator
VADVALTPTSYLVLGLVAHSEPVTSYDMKRLVSISIGYFWPFPHSQLYAEPARLAAAGLLSEAQEEGGRRRRLYRITPAGDDALRAWLREPTDEITELRDLGLLKLFFGSLLDEAGVVALAEAQRHAHERSVAELTELRERVSPVATSAQLATLELGLRWNQTAVEFWAGIAAHPPT